MTEACMRPLGQRLSEQVESRRLSQPAPTSEPELRVDTRYCEHDECKGHRVVYPATPPPPAGSREVVVQREAEAMTVQKKEPGSAEREAFDRIIGTPELDVTEQEKLAAWLGFEAGWRAAHQAPQAGPCNCAHRTFSVLKHADTCPAAVGAQAPQAEQPQVAEPLCVHGVYTKEPCEQCDAEWTMSYGGGPAPPAAEFHLNKNLSPPHPTSG